MEIRTQKNCRQTSNPGIQQNPGFIFERYQIADLYALNCAVTVFGTTSLCTAYRPMWPKSTEIFVSDKNLRKKGLSIQNIY